MSPSEFEVAVGSPFPPSLQALYGQIDAQIVQRGHIDAVTGEGNETRTLLMQYAEKGDLAAVRYLIEQGARLDVEDTYYGEGNPGRTAIIFAAYYGYADVVEYFASHALALLERHITEARIWADGGLRDQHKNQELYRRIIAALDRILHGRIDAHIVRRGHINAGEGNESRTLLMHYAIEGDLAAVRYLIEQGARLDVEDTFYGEGNLGRTAIALAAYWGRADVVEYFASHALPKKHIPIAREWAEGGLRDLHKNQESYRRIIAALDRILHGQVE
jgi:ankyrin repeat protein